jgi:hypothetical protein
VVPKGFYSLSNSWCGENDYLEDCIPKKALGPKQSEKNFRTHKGYQPNLHEVGNLWQFQEHCTSVDGESGTDSA